MTTHGSTDGSSRVDAIDRRIISAVQGGLPLVSRPYDAVAEEVGISAVELRHRLTRMHDEGIIRRIGAVPNHYALGYRANGMSVWDVDDAMVGVLGAQVGALDFVSHCYRRPRHLPAWPYNLFAMVHGRSRDELTEQLSEIERLLGKACRQHDVLFSTKILKKTGLRIAA